LEGLAFLAAVNLQNQVLIVELGEAVADEEDRSVFISDVWGLEHDLVLCHKLSIFIT
jgi:hypothetical protein